MNLSGIEDGGKWKNWLSFGIEFWVRSKKVVDERIASALGTDTHQTCKHCQYWSTRNPTAVGKMLSLKTQTQAFRLCIWNMGSTLQGKHRNYTTLLWFIMKLDESWTGRVKERGTQLWRPGYAKPDLQMMLVFVRENVESDLKVNFKFIRQLQVEHGLDSPILVSLPLGFALPLLCSAALLLCPALLLCSVALLCCSATLLCSALLLCSAMLLCCSAALLLCYSAWVHHWTWWMTRKGAQGRNDLTWTQNTGLGRRAVGATLSILSVWICKEVELRGMIARPIKLIRLCK